MRRRGRTEELQTGSLDAVRHNDAHVIGAVIQKFVYLANRRTAARKHKGQQRIATAARRRHLTALTGSSRVKY